jgi:flagella basal body P-ring formation protein FlgA
MIEKIPDVKIGDRINAIFTNNSVNISFSVTSRSEGIAGEIVRVKRDDKKIFKAKVINNTTVKIIE